MRRLIDECNKQLEYRKNMVGTDEEDMNERDYRNLRKTVLSEAKFQIRDKESEDMYLLTGKYYNKILLRCSLHKCQLIKRNDLKLPFTNFMKLELAQDNLGRALRLKPIKHPLTNPSILRGIGYVKLFALKRFMIARLLHKESEENVLKFREMIFPSKEECNLFKTLVGKQKDGNRISEVMAIEGDFFFNELERVPSHPRRSQYVDVRTQKPSLAGSKFTCEIVKLDRSDFGTLTLTENLLSFRSKSKDVDNEEYRLGSTMLMYTFTKFRKVWRVLEVTKIMAKHYNMVRQAVEITLQSRKSVFIVFFSESRLNLFLAEAKRVFHRIEVVEDPKRKFQSEKFGKEWKARRISNFEYLLQLNDYSSRSFEVLGQYPVFPWVIKNFSERQFSYAEETFRDLRHPIAGISGRKRQEARKKFANTDDYPGGRFQHGSHYLPGLGVLGYLMRMQPYTLLHYRFNAGGDCPARAFHSVATMWRNLSEQAGSNLELVPEFYYNPEFLANM